MVEQVSEIFDKLWIKLHDFLLATDGIWGKYWFSVEKNDFFYFRFSRLRTFYIKKQDLSEKNSVCHAPLLMHA
jgi:hypothetical protein